MKGSHSHDQATRPSVWLCFAQSISSVGTLHSLKQHYGTKQLTLNSCADGPVDTTRVAQFLTQVCPLVLNNLLLFQLLPPHICMPFGPVGLAEVKSVFPRAALSAVLCTGSWKGLGNMLVFAGTASQLCLQHSPLTSGLRVGKILGQDIARTADPNYPKGYSTPYDICTATKAKNKKMKWWGQRAFVMTFVLQSNCCVYCFPGSGWTLPAKGKQRVNLFSLVSMGSLCFIQLPLCWSMSFFHLVFSHPILLKSARETWWAPVGQPRLTQHSPVCMVLYQ